MSRSNTHHLTHHLTLPAAVLYYTSTLVYLLHLPRTLLHPSHLTEQLACFPYLTLMLLHLSLTLPPSLSGCAVYFCQPDALKGSLTVTMREVRPTLFFSVPRVWEKIQEKMVGMGREITGVKKVSYCWSYRSLPLLCFLITSSLQCYLTQCSAVPYHALSVYCSATLLFRLLSNKYKFGLL